MKKILILTNSKDGDHTNSVLFKLEEKGEDFFRFDVDKIGSGELKILFSLNSDIFMKKLKISFGAFDFIVDKNGQFYSNARVINKLIYNIIICVCS